MTLEQIKALTYEELRIKVAELMGWTEIHTQTSYSYDACEHVDSLAGTNKNNFVDLVPEYATDLNAAHEMVESLRKRDDSAWWDYQDYLHDVCGSTMNSIQATARQRCEAFLVGMTEEEQ